MNSAQIQALSQIQAQAIVNARPSTALIAGGNAGGKNAKPTEAQIQNQIQLQAQALVHAHTQAQIAAGIYKGGDTPKKGPGDSAAAAAKAAAPPSPAKASSPARTAKSAAAGKPSPVTKQPSLTTSKSAAKPGSGSGAASSGAGSILSSLTAAQLTQQNQLSAKHSAARDAIAKRHATELASLKSQFQAQNLASASTDEIKASQEAEMQKLLDKHASELKAMKAKASTEMADLHATFRKQNAAAEYAGITPATVPNPTTSGAATVSASSASASASHPSNIPIVSATPATLSQNQPTPMDMSGDPLDDDSGPVCSATSPEFLNKLGAMLQGFWTDQLREMRELGTTKVETEQDFKNHNDLPLARIKRIMKSDEDVRMISAEAPVLFAKACEMFILELSLRGWAYSENNKRRTLQKEDIKEAIQRTDILDFLADVIH